MVMVDIKLLAKGGLIILVIIAVAILIEQLTWPGYSGDDFEDSDIQELKINDTFWPIKNDTVVNSYNGHFVKCLRSHSESPYYPITQGRNISIDCIPPGRCIHNFLIQISGLLESLDLKLILLEPSLLFCLLPSSRKYNLLTRGYISSEFKGLKNVVTFGVESSKASILDEAHTRKKLVSFRYRILRLSGKKSLMPTNAYSDVESVPHYLIIHGDMVLHITVLYPTESYLFSSAFDSSDMSIKGLLYVNDRVFENFTTSTEYLDASSVAPVLLPSDSRSFLLDMMSSQFLKCKAETPDNVTSRKPEILMSLKELKSVLSSQMVIFWLWSKTLQGWYEKCDVHHYSEELKFSVLAKSVEGFNFPALFANSSCQHTESYSDATNNISSVQVNCYGVEIHLIFMYSDTITYWTEYVDNENIYKLRFPKFTLCSTDVYGQKVNIPCETSEILDSEYGQFLKNSTLTLHPQSMKGVVLLMKRNK